MYLVFDTETTGLPRNYEAPITDTDNWPRMVQLAWQIHDENGELVDNQDFIIKPEGFDIPYSVVKIHGITTEIANEQGRDLSEVLGLFAEAVAKCKYGVGQNIGFDYSIVGAEFVRKGIENQLQTLPKVDTMILGTDYCQLPGGKGGQYKSPKLGELYEKLYGFKFDEAHNAAADVNATAQVFFEMLRIGGISASDLNLDEAIIKHFRDTHPEPIKPFAVIIRSQVASFKTHKKIDVGRAEDIDLGQYFNFHSHTIYSSLQGSSSLLDLVKKAGENDFPAVGIVDLGNMMGAFKFVSEVEKYNADIRKKREEYFNKKETAEKEGIEFNDEEPKQRELMPIIGCEFYISDRPEQKQFTKDDPDRRTNVVLLAKNFQGYKNLAKLSSLGYLNGFYFGVPRISRQMIADYKDGLVAFTGGLTGDIPNTILEFGELRGETLFKWWKETFGDDFYVQLQNHEIDEEEYINDVLLKFADKYGVKIIAQNETYYTNESDANIQDILFCIKDGEKLSTPVGRGFGKRKGLPTKHYYLKNQDETRKAFRNYSDAFEAYDELLSKFEYYKLKRDVLLPKFDIPKEFQKEEDLKDNGKRGENEYLRYLAYEGAKKRYGEITNEIKERLDFELDVIANTGYPGYFLIVQDFCNEARKMGVWVGPGRGSAAGSAVAYCIGITNIDPIKYDLLFERFLNPERISMPDIDIDFDDEGRDKIIKWVIEKYGKMNVAQIITYSVLGGKSAIKDAGRVLEMSISETNNIAKLIPNVPGMNIAKAFSKYEKLADADKKMVDEMKTILEDESDARYSVLSSAKKMEGCIRNTGIHACGVIITPEDISNLVPITTAAKDSDILVSQFDNSVAESAGLLKMDFLGLRTLTIIKHAIKLIKQKHGIDINPDEIPLDDAKTYQLFQEGRTIGIFQYESAGMQKYMRELKPTVFADLIAMNALYRPGPIKYIPNFINRKHGKEEIIYDLPETEEYLKETYGITVYQEQVMLLSQKLANFTKGEADTLRKAMGKKQIDVLNKMYPKFIEGGKKNNLNEEKLEKIWNDWKAFAEYAFNKSHSTCYAYIAYQTAYLKANYPAEYMASVMSNNLNNTKQITAFMEDCKSMGVDVLGPDINESQYEFSVNEKGQIRFGLGAIKGIGEGPSGAIVEARKDRKYENIYDFFERVSHSKINKRVVESLVVAGAFDETDSYHRAQYFEQDTAHRTNIEKLLKYGNAFQENKNSVERSLFADFADEIKIEQPKINPSQEWSQMHKLKLEKESIGFYISAHPLDVFKYQYLFLKGDFSRKEILAEMNTESPEFDTNLPNFVEDIEDESLVENTSDTEEELAEPTQHIAPKGQFNYLSLDVVNSFRDVLKEQGDSKLKTEYIVAGMITNYEIMDSTRLPGEKTATITLEDYFGSATFKLWENNYMKCKDKIDIHRFVIIKIRYYKSKKDGSIGVGVEDFIDLKHAFERYATHINLIMELNDIGKNDIDFIKTLVEQNRGDKKLKIYLTHQENAPQEFLSNCNIQINSEMIEMFLNNNYKVFLN